MSQILSRTHLEIQLASTVMLNLGLNERVIPKILGILDKTGLSVILLVFFF